MPNFRINVDMKQKGALFNASQTKAAAARAVIAVNEAIAQEGVNRITIRLGQVLMHPTGFYKSRIAIDRRSIYRGITDSNVIYGGWLEGVTSRNRISRFKCYHTFRDIRQGLAADKVKIAQPVINALIKELS